tara:strand:+ start:371 stop:1063 length:693 start_codon:yes stop_codon:yes gene_type:complete
MEKKNLDFFLNENISINLDNFILNLLATLIFCFILRHIYIKFSSSLSNKDEFSKNFVILGITTCIVITIVKSSLALSLGLVGALSIVRFRAAIKEPEELVYLFLTIAIGLGNGAGQLKVTLIGSVIAFLTIIIFSKIKIKKSLTNLESTQISITINNEMTNLKINNLINQIKKHAISIDLVSLNKSKKLIIMNFNIVLKDFDKLNLINDIIIKIYPNANIVVGREHNISL